MNRELWVYDIETLSSCFTYSAINIDTEEIVQFVLHEHKDDRQLLFNHLKQCKGQIGFNNLNFDYPIIHLFLINFKKWSDDIDEFLNSEDIVSLLYDEAQRIINTQNQDEKVYTSIRYKDVLIQQLDLFKIWHYDNKARRTSLKSLEISMNYPNVMDMPIEHNRDDITMNEIPLILEYNLNDVLATFEFYKRSLEKINLRKDLISKYNLHCINYPDSKIGESLVLKLYSEAIGENPWDVKEGKTYRPKIAIKECIFDYIKFESREFNKFLDNLKSRVVYSTKGALMDSVIYKGFMYDFGLGGIHGCIKPGVYESNIDYIILDLDVSSLYPSIAVQNKLFPAHLGEKFCEVYESILKQRIEAKKAGNMAISDGLKLSLNSVYGKSNEVFSFMYDPLYTLRTTINGQLMLCMLAEMLVDYIPDLTVLQINTDGITVKFPRDYIGDYQHKCEWWEHLTNLQLEFVEYSKMIIRDVNNYMAIDTKGKIKYKGAFEINKDYHKDNSFKIIPIAISNYFVNNTPIEDTIKNHRNIYDFCGRQKFNTDSFGEIHKLSHNQEIIEKQQKNVRYYISNSGNIFIKQYNKGSSEIINKGFEVEIFNKFIDKEWSDYNINYKFYEMECRKILQVIEDKQLELFI